LLLLLQIVVDPFVPLASEQDLLFFGLDFFSGEFFVKFAEGGCLILW
jgi:hypothetical protein